MVISDAPPYLLVIKNNNNQKGTGFGAELLDLRNQQGEPHFMPVMAQLFQFINYNNCRYGYPDKNPGGRR
jgi:hypothetical protein